MEYKQLLEGIAHGGTAPPGQATLVTQDSRRAGPGAVFVAAQGKSVDGHTFAAAALEAGAGMVVTGRPLGLPNEVTVENPRAAYALMCANFFGRPADRLTLTAVTGTNGKTTVSSVLKQVLQALGHPCGLIGTIQSEIGEMAIPAKYTTPEAWDLHALLARMVAAGCTHAVMEASSQALAQDRLHGLRFSLGIFTNLTQDHLDYHGDMQAYFAAKASLFAQCDALLANVDDAWGRRLMDEAPCEAKRGFSVAGQNTADFTARNVDLRSGEVRFAFMGEGFLQPVAFPIPGGYSAENALAAGGAAVMLGCEPPAVAKALSGIAGVRGRCEVLHNGAFTVIRDFAHTGDAIDKLLASLKPFVASRLLVLFGCAGQRDAAKRPAMGAAAARYGDMLYITADNPREEPVAQTIADALEPIEASGKPFTAVLDREAAIHLALAEARPGDMVVLCGKGHEDYQVLDGLTLYLDERVVVEAWLAQHPPNGAAAGP
ncbi:MAG: UDP-N-acetylmuramoyl-L-alanyl-D-glutamate--2,6-diaminopimelate ligase [Ruminococcaceae bacterium]|nr:UDP-N-acetylmuramoyl-L-alanyl-D-glutamate--2,6-diaminopimelate ligase [Oscillospiraceae bacterium]